MSLLFAAAIVSGAATPQTSAHPVNPICEWAFAQADERLQADAEPATTGSASLPGTTRQALGSGTALDDAVRLCATVDDFAEGAALHPGTLGGMDPLQFLAGRCRDADAGLAKYTACFSVEQALATAPPAALPTAVPTPSPTSSPTPRATKKPGSSGKSKPTPTTRPGTSAATTPRRRTTGVPRNYYAKVPGATRVHYFTVRGKAPRRLLSSMRKQAGRYCDSDRASACMETRNLRFRYRYSQNPSTGACSIQGIQVSAAYVAHIPRWTAPGRVPAYMAWWWKKSIDRTGWHEGQHVKIAKRYAAKLPRMVAGKPCHKLNKIVKRWSRSLNRAQKAFDQLDYPRGHRADQRWWQAAYERFPR